VLIGQVSSWFQDTRGAKLGVPLETGYSGGG